jgi:hypothetical protein
MTELLIKVEPEFAREFKEISQEIFQGNDNLAFQKAIQCLRVLRNGDHFERFWEIADQIREKVNNAGGLSEKEIDRLVHESKIPMMIYFWKPLSPAALIFWLQRISSTFLANRIVGYE